jgi:nitrite reductase/ring-hydroxylating ferredoxin subunit
MGPRHRLPVLRDRSRRRFCGGVVAALGLGACDLGTQHVTLGGLEKADGGADTADLASTADLAMSGGQCGTFDAWLAAALVVGQAVYFADQDLFLCRDELGLYALTSLCPHQQCTLSKRATQFYCNCHGATFDLNGEHPTTPAHSSLVHYALCVDANGHVLIDPNTQVVASTRA